MVVHAEGALDGGVLGRGFEVVVFVHEVKRQDVPDLFVDFQEESSFRFGPMFDHVEEPGAGARAHEESPGAAGLEDEDVVAEPG